jgi:flagellin
MANIGATTAFYKVETSLTRANNEVSKSMERLATGKQNANAGDRSSYVAMSDTFRMDYVGTKAGIKGASVAMGYLETGMRVLDSASSLLSRLQELAVLGANDTNTVQDHEAINLEAEALADEFNRLMTTSTYKGKNVFVDNAASEYVSLGGRNAEMTFGIGKVAYTELYNSSGRTIAGGPNDTASVNLTHLPSDAVAAKKYGNAAGTVTSNAAGAKLLAGKYYIVQTLGEDDSQDASNKHLENFLNGAVQTLSGDTLTNVASSATAITANQVLKVGSADVDISGAGVNVYREITVDNAFEKDLEYQIVGLNNYTPTTTVDPSDAKAIKDATQQISATDGSLGTFGTTLAVLDKFKVKSGATLEQMARLNSMTQGMTFRRIGATDELTQDIEAVKDKVNTARVQAGSQYAALESAVAYTTDLTAQYELGYNTVNDVNFSMETAHLAKNQILQQAATAMLAQANSGQQSLLQLIQG